jgi:hypothetical protein
VYCAEGLGDTPTRAEARCEDAVSRALVKFGAAKMRAYSDASRARSWPRSRETNVVRLDTGAEWVAAVEAQLDGQIPNVACGSASGAFVH